ncbi:SEC-C domain-containing protein [Pseudomonas sp. RIT-To-2]|uniref:SEC-C domain-containing protein n=1 Tax=Pseudomonas sp. RIT-To-2 TaxID=3462541 RepID=UPI0024138914
MCDKHTQSKHELRRHLDDQLYFIDASCKAYDQGYTGEAKRIATAIRTLVKDARQSVSLLKQLGMKDTFYDSSLPPLPGFSNGYNGLVGKRIASDGVTYVPLLDSELHSEPVFVPFEQWWSAPVIQDWQRDRTMSRRDLVLSMTEQDGGAHVDPHLDGLYADLSRRNMLGDMSSSDFVTLQPLQGAERAAVRQIGHEILRTLQKNYRQSNPGDALVIQGIYLVTEGSEAEMAEEIAARLSSEDQVQLGTTLPPFPKFWGRFTRNEPCPCGSGRRYKHCCGSHA